MDLVGKRTFSYLDSAKVYDEHSQIPISNRLSELRPNFLGLRNFTTIAFCVLLSVKFAANEISNTSANHTNRYSDVVDVYATNEPQLSLALSQRIELELDFPALSSEEQMKIENSRIGGGPPRVGIHRIVPSSARGNLSQTLTWYDFHLERTAYMRIRSPKATTLRAGSPYAYTEWVSYSHLLSTR